MKHTLTLIAIALFALTSNARITGSVSGKITIHPAPSMHKPFLHTTVDMEDGVITFDRLPMQASSMYMLDEQGHVAASQAISRRNNKVRVKQLHPGMYTVVLKQHNRTKMFSCHTDVVVKGTRENAKGS